MEDDLWRDGVAAGMRKLLDIIEKGERGELEPEEKERAAKALEEGAKILRGM